ncbi:Heat shock protein 70 family [Trinorchestia longiramus]|nr:Heat shock protein 70 family [Trinorchestia longiramus]
MLRDIVAGIDLGSTTGRAAVILKGIPQLVITERGTRFMPLNIACFEDEVIAGYEAPDSSSIGLQAFIIDVMRLLDVAYMANIKTTDNDGNLVVDVQSETFKKTYKWTELMSLVLGKMKKDMEASAGTEVKKVVLSVPSHTSSDHKTLLAQCCSEVGFTLLTIIDRAVGVGYSYEVQKKSRASFLVFRYGANHMEASVLKVVDGDVKVCARELVAVPCMDEKIVDHFRSEISRRHGVDISGDKIAMAKLRQACQQLKHNLSSCDNAKLQIPSLVQNIDFVSDLSGARLDDLNNPIYSQVSECVRRALKSADMTASDINEVLLCGGSSRIPRITAVVRECFIGVTCRTDIDVSEVGALGAAKYAAMSALRAVTEGRFVIPARLSIKQEVLTRYLAEDQPQKSRTVAPKSSKNRKMIAEARDEPSVGIDLGTTNSCVAVARNGKVDVIANVMGNRVTPSYVAFTEDERFIGEAAKAQCVSNPRNTIFDGKRLIGRKFLDVDASENIKMWPFKVVDIRGNPCVEVVYKGTTKCLTPEEISSMVLLDLKSVADQFIGSPVKNAVITVPAYFNDSQRQATMDAGKIAGFHNISIINEPTAAAIAFGVNKKTQDKRHVLIFDLGGGTFDVAVLAIEDKNFEVLAVNGNVNLGGRDFDNRLIAHFIDEFNKKYRTDLTSNVRAVSKLRIACEEAKLSLSVFTKSKIQIPSLHDGIDFISSISRVRFELLCADLFQLTLVPVKQVITDAGLEASAIDEIVLVGGSTRIPKIKENLQKFFHGKKLNESINADEAVAHGAALHAAALVTSSKTRPINLLDVCPLTIGVAESGIFMSTLIQRNTRIPTKKTSCFSTAYDNQQDLTFAVYEGDRKLCTENNLLGQFKLMGIERAKQGQPKIEVQCAIDRNGILKVSAKDMSTGIRRGIHITSLKGRLEKKDIQRLVAEASSYGNEDKQRRLVARATLEKFCLQMKSVVDNKTPSMYSIIDQAYLREVQETLNSSLAWLDDNELCEAAEYDLKRASLEKLCANLL